MPNYRIYGFTVSSDITLPALPEVDVREEKADVTICAGAVPESAGLETSFRNWEAEPDRFFATFHESGRFLVTGGTRIRYDRFAHSDDSQVVSVLLGTCMASLLMQRQIMPIHACSVLAGDGAIVVMGVSGAGKSTMLGGLLDLGLPMLADDVTGLVLDDAGVPIAIPAFPATRLWLDSLERLGHEAEGLAKVRTDMEKYYRPVPQFHAAPAPVKAIVHLQPTNRDDAEIGPLAIEKQVECLSRFIHRKNFIDAMRLRRWAFATVTATVRQVPVFRLLRPTQWVEPTELAELILDSVGSRNALQTAR